MMVLASFLAKKKLEKARFFKKTFLLTNTNTNIIFVILFLTFSNANMVFIDRNLI